MGYFKSIAATGVMMAKRPEQWTPVTYPAAVRHAMVEWWHSALLVILTRTEIQYKWKSLERFIRDLGKLFQCLESLYYPHHSLRNERVDGIKSSCFLMYTNFWNDLSLYRKWTFGCFVKNNAICSSHTWTVVNTWSNLLFLYVWGAFVNDFKVN